jgi:hypothetical protein
VLAAIATVAGVVMLRSSDIGGSISGAVRGIGSQLSTTAPAAFAISAALVANTVAGALLIRVLRGHPYRSVTEAAIFGFPGAVLVDVVLLGVLGSLGLFSGPVVAAALSVFGALVWFRCRPLVEPRSTSARATIPIGFWVLLAVAWSAPIVLVLASPVVPFRDVMPNHVAPVEFVRTYEAFPSLFTSPSPEYGPTRQLLGYVGLLATLSKLTGVRAVLASASFVVPLTVMFALATYTFGERRIRSGVGIWALAVMPMTFSFLRLPDSRGTVVAAVLALIAFLPLPDLSDERRVLVRAALLAAGLYVHPLIGGLALGSHVLVALFLSRDDRRGTDFGIPSVLAALAFAFPELLVVGGADVPSWVIAFAVPAGIVTGIATAKLKLPMRSLDVVVLVLAGVGLVVWAATLGPRNWRTIADGAWLFPLLGAGFMMFVLTADRARAIRPYVVAPVLLGILVQVAATLFPSDTLFWSSARGELSGKAAQFWIPLFLAFATAAVLQWIWSSLRFTGALVVGVLLIALALPLRDDTVGVEDGRERRLSESLSISVRKAQFGAWSGWPDSRELIDGSQRQIVAAFRTEQDSGRMTEDTKALQVAASFQSWVATPVASFSAVDVTSLSLEPETSVHTFGGRLRALDEMPAHLGRPFEYVLLESEGLSGLVRRDIVEAGYRTVFRNTRGEIFRFSR